jgi:hypothetical protein
MLNELQTWWQNTTPETRAYLWDGGVVVAALLGGQIVGAIVARTLRARNFDAIFRLTGSSSPPGLDAGRGFTPTWIAGLLVRLTVWAAAAWWLARQHGRPDLAATLGTVLYKTWALIAVLVTALGLGSFLANRVLECVQGPPEAVAHRNGAVPQRGLAGAVAAGVYGMVILLALLVAADYFDWPLTRTSALALWQLAQHLLVAGAALLIGNLGARWAREITQEAATTPEKRNGQSTALGIVAGTTVLAVALLLSSAGLLFALAALGILGGLLWLGRSHLPDVVAGLQLRAHKVREVWIEGSPCQVGDIGLLTTELKRGGEAVRVPNHRVLETRMHGAPVPAGRL